MAERERLVLPQAEDRRVLAARDKPPLFQALLSHEVAVAAVGVIPPRRRQQEDRVAADRVADRRGPTVPQTLAAAAAARVKTTATMRTTAQAARDLLLCVWQQIITLERNQEEQ